MRKLPFMLQCMVKTARKYHLVLDSPYVPMQVRERMNVWAHPATLEIDQWKGMGWQTRCLRVHHEVATVEDLEEIAEIDESEHSDTSDCECANCATDRQHGCRHPQRCQATASNILGLIAEKWNTSTVPHCPSRSLAPEFADSRATALADGELLVFDDESARPSRAADLFRICVDSLAIMPQPAQQLIRAAAGAPPAAHATESAVHVTICAAIQHDPAGNARAACAIHYPDGEYADSAMACADRPGTYTGAMVIALLSAAEQVDAGVTLHIVTPAKAVVRALTTNLAHNVATGWLDWKVDAPGMRTVAAALRARAGATTFLYVDRHRRKHWPQIGMTTASAKVTAGSMDEHRLFQGWKAEFDIPGIGLRGIRQREAHRAIRRAAETTYEPRWTTATNVATVLECLRSRHNRQVTEEQLWVGLTSRDFSRKTRNFLWKSIHGAHKVGDYFSKMPEPWREKKDCPTCGTLESMEHILFRCSDSGQEIIWEMAQARLDQLRGPTIDDLSDVLGIASIHVRTAEGRRDKQAERDVRVVVSEAAFLIWKLRCKRRIEHADEAWQHNPEEVRATWRSIITARERHSEILTRRRRVPEETERARATPAGQEDRQEGPQNYAEMKYGPGVLVGLGPREQEGVG